MQTQCTSLATILSWMHSLARSTTDSKAGGRSLCRQAWNANCMHVQGHVFGPLWGTKGLQSASCYPAGRVSSCMQMHWLHGLPLDACLVPRRTSAANFKALRWRHHWAVSADSARAPEDKLLLHCSGWGGPFVKGWQSGSCFVLWESFISMSVAPPCVLVSWHPMPRYSASTKLQP